MAPPLSEDHEGSVEKVISQRNTSPSPLPTTGKKRERSQTPYYPNKNPRLRRLSTPPSPPLPPSPTLVTSAPSHEDQLSSSQGETIIADSEDGYSELDEDACLAYLTDEVSEQASSEPDPSSEHDTNTGYKEVYIVDPSTGHILPIWRREYTYRVRGHHNPDRVTLNPYLSTHFHAQTHVHENSINPNLTLIPLLSSRYLVNNRHAAVEQLTDDVSNRAQSAEALGDDDADQVMAIDEAERIRGMIAATTRGAKAIAAELAREERRELSEEKMRRLLTVVQPMEVADKDAFLGYALLNVVATNDGGEGPTLEASPFRRPFSNRQISKLKFVAGTDGSGLRTRDHEHALNVAVPRQCLDITYLSQSPYGPHQRIHWLPGAKEETMILLAGAHRQKLSLDLTKEHTKEIQKLEKRLEKALTDGDARKETEIRGTMEDLRNAMQYRVIWLAMVYDKEKILQTQQLSGPALIKLITNARIAPAADTEDHELSTIFGLASNAHLQGAIDAVNYLSTLNTKRSDAYKRLSTRGGDFLHFVVKTRASSAFSHFYTDSAKIVSVQQGVWGLIGPFVWYLWNQGLYMCSDIVTIATYPDLASALKKWDPSIYVSRPVLNVLMDVADQAFNEHLADILIYMGTGNEEYSQAFTDYTSFIATNLPTSLARSQNEEPITGPREMFLVKDSVYMVSSWLVPGLSSIQAVNLSGATEKLPFTSYPSAIRRYLEFWLGYGVRDDWNKTEVSQMLKESFDEGESGEEVVSAIFNVIVRLLWRYRESVLRPAQKLLPSFPRVKAPGAKSLATWEKVYDSEELEQVGKWIRMWRRDLSKESGVKKGDVTHRMGPLMPDAVRAAVDEYQTSYGEDHMLPLMNVFECYVFEFLASPTGSSNNVKFHQSRIRHLADEIVFYSTELVPSIKRVQPIVTLYAELVRVIHSFPQLANSPLGL
ncbi:hypothetical protein MD484_g7297, partial [Candolleomyces efflorescens]